MLFVAFHSRRRIRQFIRRNPEVQPVEVKNPRTMEEVARDWHREIDCPNCHYSNTITHDDLHVRRNGAYHDFFFPAPHAYYNCQDCGVRLGKLTGYGVLGNVIIQSKREELEEYDRTHRGTTALTVFYNFPLLVVLTLLVGIGGIVLVPVDICASLVQGNCY